MLKILYLMFKDFYLRLKIIPIRPKTLYIKL